MKFLLAPLVFVSLLPSTFGLLLQCTNMVQLYEAYPDFSGNGGSWGFISRSAGKTTSTLCVVSFPSNAAGKTCRLHFTNPYYVDQSGTKRGQVFSLGSPNISGATFNARGPAFRDNQLGTFTNAAEGTSAIWEGGNTFPCPTGLKAYEVVPTGDSQWISWVLPHGLLVEVVM